MTDEVGAVAPLLIWLSPSFPVGSFAFSSGLEWAVEAGDVIDAATLEDWIADLLRYGSLRSDAILLSTAWRSPTRALELNELALSLAPSAERRLETAAQGTAFLKAVVAAWPEPTLTSFAQQMAADDTAYPVAVAAAASAHAVPLRATLEAFVISSIGNLVSAVVRLGPIGQSDAQAIIARLVPAASRLAAFAETATLDQLGTASWRADIAAMRHETQYSRLFRS